MDVTCERCSTAYEFDDALVSERGTTVKCTNCGHQFRIRKVESTGGPERWVVRTVDGRELEFRALRELQAAIATAAITREDVLSRGATRPRRLGSIAELEPFFANASSQVVTHGYPAGPRPRVPTPQGLGVLSPAQQGRTEGSVAIPLPTAPRHGEDDDTIARPALNPRRPGSFPGVGSAPADGVVAGAASPRPYEAPPVPAPSPPAIRTKMGMEKTLPTAVQSPLPPLSPPPMQPPPAPPQILPAEVAHRSAPMTEREMQGTANWGTPRESRASDRFSEAMHADVAPVTPTPPQMRASFTNEEYVEPRFSSLAPPRRTSGARWIVGIVLSGILVLGAVTIGRRFIAGSGGAATAEANGDARVSRLLEDGEKAYAEGDFDGAQQHFDKASALAEKDPKVAAAVARLALVHADRSWLRKKLLADDDPELAGAKKNATVDAERARAAADRAVELTHDDVQAIRARIDALRLLGDTAAARKLVPSITVIAAQPETALTLAALDLAEDKVDFPTVLARLHAATEADNSLGRARSMLVYALARSGDGPGAKAELERLQALPRPHPLTQALRAYLARTATSVDLSSLPEVGSEIPSDWHEVLKLAMAAKAKGDPRRAGELLTIAVQKSQEDSEALTAFADQKWETGDQAGARDVYRKVMAKASPSSPWYKHAKERLDEKRGERKTMEDEPFDRSAGRKPRETAPTSPPADTSDLPSGKAPATAPVAPSAPSTPPTNAPPPGVDTSDLPGYK